MTPSDNDPGAVRPADAHPMVRNLPTSRTVISQQQVAQILLDHQESRDVSTRAPRGYCIGCEEDLPKGSFALHIAEVIAAEGTPLGVFTQLMGD